MEEKAPNTGGKTIPKTEEGIVLEALPNTMFRVALPGDKSVIVYLGGKMRMHKIRVLIGDRVAVELDDYGQKGRIVRRF